MSNKDRNNSAYPARVKAMGYEPGLTKRELIAAMVMQSLLLKVSDKDIASLSVKYAEELLKQLTDIQTTEES